MPLIEISEAALQVLGRWASVGRTIDTTVRLLDLGQDELLDTEDVIHCTGELQELKRALDECNSGAKEVAFLEANRTQGTCPHCEGALKMLHQRTYNSHKVCTNCGRETPT